jgi:uncharacterized protein YjbI with pentapeptide repeats
LDELLETEVHNANEYEVLEGLVEARLSSALAEFGRADAASLAVLTAACTSVAIVPDRPRRDTGNPPAVLDTLLDDAIHGALAASGILRVLDSKVRFAHHALAAFFIAKALIEGTTDSEAARLRPSIDVMALLRAWLSGPSRRVGRYCLRWSQLDLSNADMAEWDLARTNLKDTVLASADLTRADLQVADLRNADLSKVLATGANLTDTDCDSADFSAGELSDTSFSGANLTRTRIGRANLRGAVFTRVSLQGADLRGTELSDVTFREVRYDASTQWPSGFIPPPPLP